MNIFLDNEERAALLAAKERPGEPAGVFLDALLLRAEERAGGAPGDAAVPWWYTAAEYLSDAAMAHAIRPGDRLREWIRARSLEIAARPADEWVGPAFRDHSPPLCGHLETAHACWGLSAVLDLCGDIFSAGERDVIRAALVGKGIHLCSEWLKRNRHLANWRGVMASGALVAAAVLEDEQLIRRYVKELAPLRHAFQPDGSYGESLQYGNYLANALTIAYEALIRKYPREAAGLEIGAYAKGMSWMAQSMLYRKPVSGWGRESRARAVNFNDSAALFRPSGDVLMHVAVRYLPRDEREAALARWLFREYYESCPGQGPHELATFGMRNDWGFLTPPLLTHVSRALSPEEAELPLTAAFSNGNVLVRDRWEGRSVLAMQAGNNDGCYAPGHLQGDLNSFILAWDHERLLADPGHSCYRNLIHSLESATQTHNTCIFLLEQDQLGLQEDMGKVRLLEQKNVLPRRLLEKGKPGPPVERGGRLLACRRQGEVSLVVSEAGASYGDPVREFTRAWIQAGEHLTIVYDRIRADRPVKTVWNWTFNNRDFRARAVQRPGELIFYRPKAALRLFRAEGPEVLAGGPVYAHLHDAYHIAPGQRGEGVSGSALLYRFTDRESRSFLESLHILVADGPRDIERWTLERPESKAYRLGRRNDGRPGEETWILEREREGIRFRLWKTGAPQQTEIDLSGPDFHMREVPRQAEET